MTQDELKKFIPRKIVEVSPGVFQDQPSNDEFKEIDRLLQSYKFDPSALKEIEARMDKQYDLHSLLRKRMGYKAEMAELSKSV